MTDTTPKSATEKLQASDNTDHSLRTDYSWESDDISEKKLSDQEKRMLSADLAREHFVAQHKKANSLGSKNSKLFKSK